MTRLRHPASNILLVLSILLWGIEKARSFQHPNAKLFCSTRANTNFVRSPLFSFSPIENQDRKGEPPLLRKRDVARARLAQLVTKLLTFQTVVSENARNFLKKQQVKAASTFLINALILSIFFKDVFVSSYNPHKNNVPTTTVVEKPMQVPYSKFMDWCEGNKNRGSFFNPKPLVYLDNVHVESSGKIGYCLLTAETRAQKQALQEYIQNSKNGVPESVSQAKAVTHIVNTNSDLIQFLRENKVEFQAKEGKISNSDRIELLPTVVIAGVAYNIYKNSGGPVSSSSSKGLFRLAKRKNGEVPTSFEDVQGVDDAKRDVMELVDTLRNPSKFRLVGARAPRGLLLEGPPGTGKTTLARACASMANIPFFHCSGSAFVEKYVGTGAARVRKLFAQAEKRKGPCIIFIDEIDALGKARKDGDSGGSNGNNESEQTLNQLLACMDGLDSTSQICVLGATNRKDVLDPALIRPGRFDRIVKVALPNAGGREQILRLHAGKLIGFKEGSDVDPSRYNSLGIGKTVDLSALSEATDGLSGAELEFIVNEAAIFAVRRVSAQLEQGVDESQVDVSVYPQDFEESVASFFQSRNDKQKNTNKQFGIVVDDDYAQLGRNAGKKVFYSSQQQIFK